MIFSLLEMKVACHLRSREQMFQGAKAKVCGNEVPVTTTISVHWLDVGKGQKVNCGVPDHIGIPGFKQVGIPQQTSDDISLLFSTFDI